MVLASIILGILLIIGGFSSMAAPLDTYFGVAKLLAVLLFVYGIFAIVRFIKTRENKTGLIVGILAVIIGFVYLFRPGDTPPAGTLIGLDRFVLVVIALWYILKGCFTVVNASKTRPVNRRWFWQLIVGILSVLLGVYSLFYPEVAAVEVGTLIGFCYVQCGLDLLVFGLIAGKVTGGTARVEQEVRDAVSAAGEAVNKMADEAGERIEAAADAVARKIVRPAAPAEDAEAPAEDVEAPADEAKDE